MIAGLGAVGALWWPTRVYGGPVVRVATTTETVTDVAVGGGRVFWASWGGDDASVFSGVLTAGARRLLRVPDLEAFDDVSPYLWASAQRVAVQVDTYFAGADEDYYDTAAYATGRVGDAALRPLVSSPHPGYERLQDISGDEVLSVAVKRVGGRWTVRAYVRAGAGPRPVGPRVKLGRDEWSGSVEGRLSARWMALLRRRGDARITVYDRRTNRSAWSVRLPQAARTSVTHGRDIVWDLDEDGTLAVALGVLRGRRHESFALGWVRPGASFHRVTRVALPRYPFALRGGTLTYTRPATKDRVRVFARRRRGAPRAVTGELPAAALVASDGNLVAAAIARPRDPTVCVFAAALPIAPAQRWRCPAATDSRGR